MLKQKLTNEQMSKVEKMRYQYQTAAGAVKVHDNDLYSRLIDLDDTLKKRALIFSIIEGIIGFILLTTGYNFLTHLSNAFLGGIIFFSIGAIIMTMSIPVYNLLVNNSRKKYAPVVLTITSYLG